MPTAGGGIDWTLLGGAAREIAALGRLPPIVRMLGDARRRAALSVWARYQGSAAGLEAGLERGEPAARREFERLVERALLEMRRQVDAEAGRAGLRSGWAAVLDAWWRDTEAGEYLDDPRLDRGVRVQILSDLDEMNELLGSYASFFARLEPFLAGDRPTRLLDLAAGHGGFALFAAELARKAGHAVTITASDIKAEYLELGRERAQKTGVKVSFALQDALDLSNLAPGAFDVITCTQSLHHFRPGQIALMFAEASRVATRGVTFIDGARSARNAAAFVGIGLLLFRNTAFAHDALVSFRRFYVPEELELIARLCPGGEHASADWILPGHCVLELRQPARP
jgi:2-polyprenyl-3-methyl-5-hydroxy-6-metoxy-1,4-benzoquinol methylase